MEREGEKEMERGDQIDGCIDVYKREIETCDLMKRFKPLDPALTDEVLDPWTFQ